MIEREKAALDKIMAVTSVYIYTTSHTYQKDDSLLYKEKFLLKQSTLGQGIPDAKGCLEVIIGDSHGCQDLCINLIIFQINDIHLLSNTLQSGFCAQSSQICSYETMCILHNQNTTLIFANSMNIASTFSNKRIGCLSLKDTAC